MEALIAIGCVLCVIWVLWGTQAEKDDPAIKAHNSILESKLEMHSRRYTNVAQGKKVRTIKHSSSGHSSGKGNGGAASKKPNLLGKAGSSKL